MFVNIMTAYKALHGARIGTVLFHKLLHTTVRIEIAFIYEIELVPVNGLRHLLFSEVITVSCAYREQLLKTLLFVAFFDA